jgi:hypothetical protein
VPINFPDQCALTSWGNLVSHYRVQRKEKNKNKNVL